MFNVLVYIPICLKDLLGLQRESKLTIIYDNFWYKEMEISTPIPFGLHKGKAFNSPDVPDSYRQWMSGYHDGLINLNNPVTLQELLADDSGQGGMYGAKAFDWLKKNYPEFITLAREYIHGKHQCLHCGGKLVPIGHDRANGADHDDWGTRLYHKKCFKQLKHENG